MQKILFLACLCLLIMSSAGFAQNAPTLTMYVPANNTWSSSTSVTFGYDVGDFDCDLSSVKLYVAPIGVNPFSYPSTGFPVDLPFNSCGGSYQKTVTIPKGSYNWAVEAKDATGRYKDSPLWYLNVQTNRAPSVTINTLTVNGTSITASWSGTDPDGDALQYRTRIDAGSWSSKSSSTSVTINNISSGSHTFYVEVSDASLSNTASKSFTIAVNHAPYFGNVAPANNAHVTSTSVQFSYEVGDDDCNLSSIKFYVATGTNDPYTSPMSGYPKTLSSSSCGFSGLSTQTLAYGQYRWGLKATDAENVTAVLSARTLYVDNPNQPPAVVLITPTSNQHLASGSGVRLYFTISDPEGGQVATKLYLTNTCSTPRSCPMSGYPVSGNYGNGTYYYAVPTTLAPGPYSWEMQGTDDANNVVWSQNFTFFVDANQPPTVTLLSPTSGQHYIAGTQISLNFSVYDPEGGQVATKLYLTNTCSSPRSCPMSGYPVSATFSNGSYSYLLPASIAPGLYSWEMQGTDNANNVAWSQTWTFTIDANQPPTVMLISPTNGTHFANGQTVALQYAVNDPEKGPLTVKLYVSNTCSTPRSCPMSGFPVTLSQSSGTYPYAITAVLAAGTYYWEMSATDNAGNTAWSQTWSFIIDPVNHPPTVAIGDIVIVGGTGAHICWAGADPDPGQGITFRYKLDNDVWSPWSTQSCANYTNLPEGLHTFYVEVKDSPGLTGSDQKQFTIAPQGPTISVQDVTTTQGVFYTLQITSSSPSGIKGYQLDLTGDGVYEANFGPEGITFAFWQEGSFHPIVKVIAMDGQTAITTFALVVAENDPTPDLAEDVYQTVVPAATAIDAMYTYWDSFEKASPQLSEDLVRNIDDLAKNIVWTKQTDPRVVQKYPGGSDISQAKSWSYGTKYEVTLRFYRRMYPGQTQVTYEPLVIIDNLATKQSIHVHRNTFVNIYEPGKSPIRVNILGNKPIDFPELKPGFDVTNNKYSVMLTDLTKKHPELTTSSQIKTLADHPERYNLNDIKLRSVDVVANDIPGKGELTFDAAISKAKYTAQQRPVIIDGVTTGKSSTLGYFLKGGKLISKALGAISIVVTAYDIGVSLANNDIQGAICKGAGAANAWVTVTGYEGACQPVCGGFAVVTTPLGGAACEVVGCFAGGIVVGVFAYTGAQYVCNEIITVSIKVGTDAYNITINSDEYKAVQDEMDRLGLSTPTKVVMSTKGISSGLHTILSSSQIMTVLDSLDQPIIPDNQQTFSTSTIDAEGVYQEVFSTLKGYSGRYKVVLNTNIAIPESTYTITYVAAKYDTLVNNVMFKDAPATGYTMNIHVNQPPVPKFSVHMNGSSQALADSVVSGVGKTLTIYPDLSTDPDGDALKDFSVDVLADNSWEFNQVTNFSQGYDLAFSDTGHYPVVLRVRDQYGLSGFDTLLVIIPPPMGIDDESNLPATFSLAQNYPNPFNPTTTIAYSLAKTSDVEIVIYNVVGQEVRRFSLGKQPAGEHSLIWTGVGNTGEGVSSGVYFYRLTTPTFTAARKMLLLK